MATRKSASSLREKRLRVSGLPTMTLGRAERAELAKLSALADGDIDTSDAPEKKRPKRVVVGRFYRPVKEQISLRVDADVLAFFRQHGPYQTYMNQVLRREMDRRGRG